MKFMEDLLYVVVRREASVLHIILTAFERGAIVLAGDIDAIISGLDVFHRSDKFILSIFRPFGRTLHEFVNLTLSHAAILACRKQCCLLDTRRVSFCKKAISDRGARYIAIKDGNGADCLPSPNRSRPRTKRISLAFP